MKKNNPQSIILALIIVAFITVLSLFIAKGMTVETLDKSILIKGLYGREVLYTDIKSIQKIDSIPIWGIKTNGINLGFINIGMFTYQELGKVRLFEIKKEEPYVLIEVEEEKIILGFGREKNEEVYRIIEEKIKEK